MTFSVLKFDRHKIFGPGEPKMVPSAANDEGYALQMQKTKIWVTIPLIDCNKRSFKDEDGNYWAFEGTGKNAVFHKFVQDKNDPGKYHWVGSSNSRTKSGKQSRIQEQFIPNEIKRQAGYN